MTAEPHTHQREGRMWREVRHYASIDRPFAAVAQLLSDAPGTVLGRTGDDPGARERVVGLHLRHAGMDLSRDVRVVLGRLLLDTDAARLPMQWVDAHRPKLFPVLVGALEVIPVPTGPRPVTQVGVVARYRPPLGRLGTIGDAAAGSRVVLESVEQFIEDLAARIEAEIDPPAGAPASEEEPIEGS